ncbi:hypothetical protein E4U21_002332, partial [Claviceps maximensis]
HLNQGYILPGGSRAVHMMLMSWARERAKASLDEMAYHKALHEASCAIQAWGVIHHDQYCAN